MTASRFRYWPGILTGIAYALLVWAMLVLAIVVLSAPDDAGALRTMFIAFPLGALVIVWRYLCCRIEISAEEILVVNPWRPAVTLLPSVPRYAEVGNAWSYALMSFLGPVLIVGGNGTRVKVIATLGLRWKSATHTELRERLVAIGVRVPQDPPPAGVEGMWSKPPF